MPGSEFAALRDCLAEPPSRQTYAAAAHALLRELRDQPEVTDGTDARLRRLYDRRDTMIDETAKLIAAENGLDLTDPLQRGRAERAVDEALERWEMRESEDQTPAPTTPLETRLQKIYRHCELIKAIEDTAEFGGEEEPLVRKYDLARGRSSQEIINISAPSENADARIDTEAVEQIAAAFRFGIQDNKIDALPENLETLDRAMSQDTYEELVAKAQVLDARLKRSNADPYAGFVVERLLQSLGTRYDDVKPGVALSRLRSIESIISSFDTQEGRAALFPDAIAMFTDLHLSGQDFLATFPNVRRIERERIAAGLEKDPAVIDKALEETEAIHSAAAGSEIVTPRAVDALGENELDIREAQSVEVKADLVADRLLIHRNFVSQALRAIARKSGDAWEVVGPDFVAGSKAAARMIPPLAVIALITTIAGPIVGLAGLLRSDLFKSVRGAVTAVRRSVSTPRRKGRRSGNADRQPDSNLDEAIKHICKKYGVSPEFVTRVIGVGDYQHWGEEFDYLSAKARLEFVRDINRVRHLIDGDSF
jgi:hypothetical protein